MEAFEVGGVWSLPRWFFRSDNDLCFHGGSIPHLWKKPLQEDNFNSSNSSIFGWVGWGGSFVCEKPGGCLLTGEETIVLQGNYLGWPCFKLAQLF